MPQKPNRRDSPESEPAWSFDDQGDYAVSRSDRVQRIAPIAVALLWVGLVFYNGGLGYAIRSAAFYLIPVACIWRPDVLGGIGTRVSPFTTIDGPTSERMVRIAGWLWLFFPVWVYLFGLLFKASAS